MRCLVALMLRVADTSQMSLRVLALAIGVAASAPVSALDYPAPTQPDPLRLRSCPISLFGSHGWDCELLGLAGPVSRVGYSTSPDGTLDQEYRFDRSGRITAVNHRIRDIIGGWSRRTFSYRSDGLLDGFAFNGISDGKYQYEEGRLKSFAFPSNYQWCDLSFFESETISMTADCRDMRGRPSHSMMELDRRGRVLKLDRIAAHQFNLEGSVQCEWIDKGGRSSSRCSNGSSTHLFEYDERMRPLSYTRQSAGSHDKLKLSYTYIDDQFGNWTTQIIRYEEIDFGADRPADLRFSRAIDYFH